MDGGGLKVVVNGLWLTWLMLYMEACNKGRTTMGILGPALLNVLNDLQEAMDMVSTAF